MSQVKVIDLIENMIQKYIEEMRPPIDIRDKLDIGYKYKNNTLEIYEIRPHWKNKEIIRNHSFAKAKFIKSRNTWDIYWMRANGNWIKLKTSSKTNSINHVFEIINTDEQNCFFG